MTKEASFKRRVRDRMSKTGESYAAARSQVSQKRDRVQAARTRLAATEERPTDDKVAATTGRRWAAWFSLLDRWSAHERTHGETAAFLAEEHDVPGWWAQTITVWYQRARGMRLKHQQADGFTIYASRTVAVPLDVVFDAFVEDRSRRKWLTDGTMSLRTSQPGHTARFDWGDGSTRVSVSFEAKGPAKATVAVAHERLPDADEAEAAKASWRARLAHLKSALEEAR
ncbi:MAG TPA: hypothetical protein VKD21_01965 [Acidimicrobiales bacterium]|nr:hypothetical protein [Acidimicrobiales bacterium]